MTTAQLIAEVSYGDLGVGGISLERRLRRIIIPQYLSDIDRIVGKPYWRKGIWTQAVVANTRSYALPNDFKRFQKLAVYDASDPAIGGFVEIVYRGEFSDDILMAETGGADDPADNNIPLGYYIQGDDSALPKLWFTKTPTSNFTVKGQYDKKIYFADDTTSVDLNPYIPEDWQGGLIHALEYTLAVTRYGMGDKRADMYKREYQAFIQSKIGDRHPAVARRVTLMR